MAITIKKPALGKLVKGRDHKLRCQMVWNDEDETPVDLYSEVAAMYVTIKSSDSLADEDAEIAINSLDNSDQFILDNSATPIQGKMVLWIKKTDQANIVPDTVKYCMDLVVVLTDGTEWPFVLDYNLMFCKPPTGETGYGA